MLIFFVELLTFPLASRFRKFLHFSIFQTHFITKFSSYSNTMSRCIKDMNFSFSFLLNFPTTLEKFHNFTVIHNTIPQTIFYFPDLHPNKKFTQNSLLFQINFCCRILFLCAFFCRFSIKYNNFLYFARH